MDTREKGSVLPREARASFRGLNYFPVDTTYRMAVVDFNRAYNPDYACPLPPEENKLARAIPAGEKRPALGVY